MGLADSIALAIGHADRVEITAYDGSRAGTSDAVVRIEVRDPSALSSVASAPGALGLARAYVTGRLDIVGDIYAALRTLSDLTLADLPWSRRLQLLRTIGSAGLRNRPKPPPQEARLRGRKHSKARDQQAISHHYDVSNRFYEWLLGPSMTYTCAAYPTSEATLEQAQWFKHDLVARKLGLREGMRLLDVGCGWGGMVLHAARHYGVRSLGVTLSRPQAEWAQQAIESAGLGHLAEVRHLDYRDVRESGFDAVASIGLTEHIGAAQLRPYFRSLYRKLRPGGRLLNHCITRPSNRERGPAAGGFIGRYVFPDGELVGVGRLVSHMHDTGFEVRHEENLREHYAKTLTAWSANLDARWAESVAEVGEATARIWRLYLAGSRLGFESNNIQLHQVLGVRLDGADAGVPLRPDWEPTVAASDPSYTWISQAS